MVIYNQWGKFYNRLLIMKSDFILRMVPSLYLHPMESNISVSLDQQNRSDFPRPCLSVSVCLCLSVSHSTIHVRIYQEQTSSIVMEPLLVVEEMQRSSLTEHINCIWLLYQPHDTFNILRTN